MEDKETIGKTFDDEKDKKPFDCRKSERISKCLAAIGVATAAVVTLKAYANSHLNFDFLFDKLLGLPTLIFFVLGLFIAAIKIIFYYLKYGELDSLEGLIITRKLTLKNILQITYLFLVLAICPFAGYVISLGAVISYFIINDPASYPKKL